MINIGNKEVIHFIGIGGIGMSGLAQIMKIMGFNVQGSDLKTNKNIENCKKVGIKIFIGHSKKNISKATIIVKSSAITKKNIEYTDSEKRKMPIYERAEMLANIVSLKKNIVISGSHGKTTTTSLVAKILSEAKLEPTIINGGVINSIKSNAKFGRGEWAVLEADESDGSFLKLPINYSVITNVDNEHLDFYKNYQNLKRAFIKFINKTPPIGKSIVCIDDANLKDILKEIKTKNYFTYGFNEKANYQILKPKYKSKNTSFEIKYKNNMKKNIVIKNIVLNLIGKHNVLNATAAIAICLNLGIRINILKKALRNFSGVQRRLTKIFSKEGKDFYDDYAHHPTEIKSVLEGIKQVYKKRKILSVFQPHRYSRIKNLKLEFSKSFTNSDLVILCPIYAAGEKKDKTYNQNDFSRKIAKNSKVQVININNEIDLKKYLKINLIKDEIVIGMGAGSISKWMRELEKKL
ncbi:MAG: UDP-N-acetylmuramate--L-alanine ligase [Pelagibacteraceae bacterium TMED287]|nr:MAG: UDP-N-acetylmuramate--L-alanine ligase [Pelagibacteraceae bacterium TMED287]|tara:strand:+ start:350 stop:1741 length:1392 start_codon:yes stop_codon:yes gene_type:complete